MRRGKKLGSSFQSASPADRSICENGVQKSSVGGAIAATSTSTIRIAHLSDLHIGFLSRRLSDWFSKGIIAQLNYLLNIHRRFNSQLLQVLPAVLRTLAVDCVLISGDFTTAGSECEFLAARDFLEQLQKIGVRLLLIPGNHDHYTKRQKTSGFYRHLYPFMHGSGGGLYTDRFERLVLDKTGENPWDIWLLDQAEPTPWMSSQGIFDQRVSTNLSRAMREHSPLTRNAIICGHFPLHNASRRLRELLGRRALRDALTKQKNVRLYAHGHTHQFHIFDERPRRGAICADAGSATQRGRAGFNLYELGLKTAKLRRFYFGDDLSQALWPEAAAHTWTWS